MSVALRQLEAERLARRFGAPLRGDPRFYDGGGDALMTRRACQYACAMLQRAGRAVENVEACEARYYAAQRLVVFTRDGVFVAAWRIADRVMDYDPYAAAVHERAS